MSISGAELGEKESPSAFTNPVVVECHDVLRLAFAAGSGDDYGTTAKMPSSYMKAVKIIKSGKYREAIPLLC